MHRGIRIALLACLGASCGRINFDAGSSLGDGGSLADGPIEDGMGGDGAQVACNVGTPSLVQNQCKGADAASVSVTLPSNITAGNFLLVAVNYASATANPTVTDTAGNTLQLGEIVRSASSTSAVFFALITNAGPDTLSVSLDGPSAFVGMFVQEFTGVGAAAGSTSQTGTGTSATTPTLATSVSDTLLFGHAVSDDIITGVGAGFTSIQTCAGDRTASRVVATPGSYAATYTIGTSVAWRATLTAFRPCF